MDSIEEEIIKNMGNQIQQEIDFVILSSLLCEIGWTKVILDPMSVEDSYSVDEWTAINIKGNVETCGLVWIFERKQDANWFKLRWQAR